MSIQREDDVQAAFKLLESHQHRAQHWLVLSPIQYMGRLYKLSTAWSVISKPLHQRVLKGTLVSIASGQATYQSDAEEELDDENNGRACGHILLVEDNPTIQTQMRKILVSAGKGFTNSKPRQTVSRVTYRL
jgi:hypothetical protein